MDHKPFVISSNKPNELPITCDLTSRTKNKKVIIQGWGNVGSAAAYYISQEGAKIVGIIDKEGGLIKEQGFSFDEIRELYIEKRGNKLHNSEIQTFNEVNDKIWDLENFL